MSLLRLDGTQLCTEADPEFWFPEGSLSYENRLAIRMCGDCNFTEQCLEYALENNVEGIWGGTTVQQRRDIRKKRGIVAKPVYGLLSESPDAIKARQRRAKRKEERENE